MHPTFSVRRGAVLVLALAVSTLFAPVAATAGEPGDAGLLWLRFGVGARAGAMGETGVASAVDVTAVHWNPANLADVDGTEMAVQHSEYLGLFRRESLALSHATRIGTFGLSLNGFYSDELERTEIEGSGAAAGTFRPYGAAAGLSFARSFPAFTLGATVKFVHENIDAYNGSSYAFDLGIAHQATIEGLRLAASVQNLGPAVTLNEEDTALPRTIRGGASYRPAIPGQEWLERFQFAAEVVAPNDGNSRLHAGAEVRIHESFAVRAGHRFSYDVWGSTFGAGFRRGPLVLDYAFMDNSVDAFDTTHRISLRLAYLP